MPSNRSEQNGTAHQLPSLVVGHPVAEFMATLTLRGTVTIDKPGHAGLAWQVTREEFRHETRRERIGTMAATQAQREEMGLTLDAKRHGEGSHVVQPAPSMKKSSQSRAAFRRV